MSAEPEQGTRLSAVEIHENLLAPAERELRRPAPALLWSSLASGMVIGFSCLASAFGASVACGSCHVIPGVERARGLVGPPLTEFAERTYIAGNVFNTPDNLAAWIRLPDSVEPGTVMPPWACPRRTRAIPPPTSI